MCIKPGCRERLAYDNPLPPSRQINQLNSNIALFCRALELNLQIYKLVSQIILVSIHKILQAILELS